VSVICFGNCGHRNSTCSTAWQILCEPSKYATSQHSWTISCWMTMMCIYSSVSGLPTWCGPTPLIGGHSWCAGISGLLQLFSYILLYMYAPSSQKFRHQTYPNKHKIWWKPLLKWDIMKDTWLSGPPAEGCTSEIFTVANRMSPFSASTSRHKSRYFWWQLPNLWKYSDPTLYMNYMQYKTSHLALCLVHWLSVHAHGKSKTKLNQF
jgi:hypothetical protein